MQWLGLYVASFLLVAAFMCFHRPHRLVEVALSRLPVLALMFITFELAFDVIMPKGPLEAAFGF